MKIRTIHKNNFEKQDSVLESEVFLESNELKKQVWLINFKKSIYLIQTEVLNKLKLFTNRFRPFKKVILWYQNALIVLKITVKPQFDHTAQEFNNLICNMYFDPARQKW